MGEDDRGVTPDINCCYVLSPFFPLLILLFFILPLMQGSTLTTVGFLILVPLSSYIVLVCACLFIKPLWEDSLCAKYLLCRRGCMKYYHDACCSCYVGMRNASVEWEIVEESGGALAPTMPRWKPRPWEEDDPMGTVVREKKEKEERRKRRALEKPEQERMAAAREAAALDRHHAERLNANKKFAYDQLDASLKRVPADLGKIAHAVELCSHHQVQAID